MQSIMENEQEQEPIKNIIPSTTVPTVPYGIVYNNKNLPDHIPIIGLGCSSFSNLFDNDNDYISDDDLSLDDDEMDNNNNDDDKVEELSASNPKVAEWIDTIRFAISSGITLLDTAPWYGTSEKVIGLALKDILLDGGGIQCQDEVFKMEQMKKKMKENEDDNNSGEGGTSTTTTTTTTITNNNNNNNNNNNVTTDLRLRLPRSSLIINTKVGRYVSVLNNFEYSHKQTVVSIVKSIECMQCRYIDVLSIHDVEFCPDDDLLFEHTLPAILYCKDRGYVKAIGITGYPLNVQRRILERARGWSMNNGNDGDGVGDFVFDQSLTYCHLNLHDRSLFRRMILNDDDNDDNDNIIDENKCEKKVSSIHKITDCLPIPFLKNRSTHKMKYKSSSSFKNDTTTPTTINQSSSSFAEYCHTNSIALLAAAPLSMGLLTQNKNLPNWHPASKELRNACRKAVDICETCELVEDEGNNDNSTVENDEDQVWVDDKVSVLLLLLLLFFFFNIRKSSKERKVYKRVKEKDYMIKSDDIM